jgi:predicted ATP-grasp superfamily ATP-dependent carboligase
MRVLVAGVSTRAAAESAARAGFEVTAVDAFADLDQHASVRSLSLPRDFGVSFSAAAAARAARDVDCDAVAYLSSFENHPAAVRALAAGRTLLGNPPEVLARVRDPLLVARALRRRGLAVPAVRDHRAITPPEARHRSNRVWMLKPRASGGGHGMRPTTLGAQVAPGWYLQERIEGTPGSVVFVAARGRAVALGVSRQLVGEPAFGCDGYRYCGSILAPLGDPQFEHEESLANVAFAIADAVAEDFGLVGVNGVDFVASDGVPYPVEVNPRYSASMELVECAYGLSIFGLHAAACSTGELPRFDVAQARRTERALGKAILFARADVSLGDTRAWIGDRTVRDVPRPGERIPRGRPVCTVFAEGRDAAECRAALERRASAVYDALARWEKEVA